MRRKRRRRRRRRRKAAAAEEEGEAKTNESRNFFSFAYLTCG